MLESITSPSDLKNISLEQKKMLAAEIRKKIIDTVNCTGGHLASNLGAVEMTIALHSVLSAPRDKLIFDVGHQCYAHKLLTGRYAQFDSLRQFQGISGFTRPNESEYDLVASGHASDSISLALGFAKARDIRKDEYHVAAVIGDGALTGGMSYEALNDAGQSKTRMLIVLNDNKMSISPNVGSVSMHLTHMRQSSAYRSMKQHVRSWINRLPKGGRRMETIFTRVKNSLKALLVSDRFFDALDVEYLGPINGHDIGEMERVFKMALTYDRPVVVHIVTRKGKGYPPAEDNPSIYHGIEPQTDHEKTQLPNTLENCGKTACSWLIEKAGEDKDIVCISAAMLSGTGLDRFQNAFPNRCYDVGIAEEHAVALSAGLALNGLKPYVALYSTFAQRAYDQININVCLNRAPVRLLIDRSGLNGADGETHQGVFDTGLLRGLPGVTVAAPASIEELHSLLKLSQTAQGPFAIKYPKFLPRNGNKEDITLGKWSTERTGRGIAIISYGRMLSVAMRTAARLREKGFDPSVINARFLKPLDEEMVKATVNTHRLTYVLEDCVQCGSLGEALSVYGKVLCLCVPDAYIPAGTIEQQQKLCGLDEESVEYRILTDAKESQLWP